MAGYFGTETQQRLQAQAEKSADFSAVTPGACQAGRTMGCDDPDQVGWDRIGEFIDRDGVCGFRLINTADGEAMEARLSSRHCRFDTWGVFLADRESAGAAANIIAAQTLPAGMFQLPAPTEPEGKQMHRLQTLIADAGLVPFSGSMLAGSIAKATTVVIGDENGKLVASAHGYMPHNSHSPYRHYAWGGLVAVAEHHRGKGLGKIVNALMIEQVFRDLRATHIYELVSISNMPSRRMVEACRLALEPSLTCGIATPVESARFTK
jgi:RimJ/RimL family protein N-acetyltransferase